MRLSPKRILVLAPHPDDGEFGCGATLARFIEEGAEVFYSTFSLCEASLPAELPKDQLRSELGASMREFGIPGDHVTIRNYPVRYFHAHRQEILENLVDDRKLISPDLVFLPASTDIHQDHQVIYNEGSRAFKHETILGYELPWNTAAFEAVSLSKLDEKHVEKKEKALRCYKSQSFRPYFQSDFVRSLARTRGTQLGKEFAEAFQILRLCF